MRLRGLSTNVGDGQGGRQPPLAAAKYSRPGDVARNANRRYRDASVCARERRCVPLMRRAIATRPRGPGDPVTARPCATSNGSEDALSRAVSPAKTDPLEDAARINGRMESTRGGKLKIENRRERRAVRAEATGYVGAQDLAGEEDVDGEARAFVAAKHERADERRDQQIDKPVPRAPAAEVEPVLAEAESHEMDDRTDQQGDRQEPEAGGRETASLSATSMSRSGREWAAGMLGVYYREVRTEK